MNRKSNVYPLFSREIGQGCKPIIEAGREVPL